MPTHPAVSLVAMPGRRSTTLEIASEIERRGFAGIFSPSMGDVLALCGSLAHYYVFGRHRPGGTDVWQEFERYRHERGFARDLVRADRRPLEMRVLEGTVGSLRGAVGTPAQIRDLVARYEDAGVDQVIFVSQAGKNQHEHICESLELFAKEVMPDLHEGEDEREQKKLERLAPAMDAALARREPPRQTPDDYSFMAVMKA